MNKNVLIALAVFALLLVAVIAVRGRDEKVGVKELEIAAIDKATVTRIEVALPPKERPATPPSDGDVAATNEAGPRKVVLEKDGEGWRVFDGAVPDKKHVADPAQVTALLDAAAELEAGDLVADRKERHAAFEIDDAKGHGLKIDTAKGAGLDLVFGRAAKAGGSTVRARGSDDVFVVKGRLASLVKKDVGAWRKKAILDVKADDLASITVAFPDRPAAGFTLTATAPEAPPKEADGADAGDVAPGKPTWRLTAPTPLPAGFRVDGNALPRLATTLATLRATDFADGVSEDKAGFAVPHPTVEATTSEGKKIIVHVGQEDERKRVHLKVDGDPQVYLVAGYTAKQLLKPLDELRDTALIEASLDDVERVTFKGTAGTVVVKKEGGGWKRVAPMAAPAGFDDTQIEAQVASVLRLRANKVAKVSPKEARIGAGPTIEIVRRDGKKQVVRFGGPVPEEGAESGGSKDGPREHYVQGAIDDLIYVTSAFTKGRYDKPADLFLTPPEPPHGMGDLGGMAGLDKLPPDVRRKLEESIRSGKHP